MIERRQVMDWLTARVAEDELLVTPPAHVFFVEELGSPTKRKPSQTRMVR